MRKLTKREERILKVLEAERLLTLKLANKFKNKGDIEMSKRFISEANGLYTAQLLITEEEFLQRMESEL